MGTQLDGCNSVILSTGKTSTFSCYFQASGNWTKSQDEILEYFLPRGIALSLRVAQGSHSLVLKL
jgi:hypothetical protein